MHAFTTIKGLHYNTIVNNILLRDKKKTNANYCCSKTFLKTRELKLQLKFFPNEFHLQHFSTV